jgi:hypothetical protein
MNLCDVNHQNNFFLKNYFGIINFFIFYFGIILMSYDDCDGLY